VLHSHSPRVRVSTPVEKATSEAAAASPRGRRRVHSYLCDVSMQHARCTPRLTPHRRAKGSAADVDLGALSRRAAVCLTPAPHSRGTVARACAVSTVPANTPRSHPEARSTDHGRNPGPVLRLQSPHRCSRMRSGERSGCCTQRRSRRGVTCACELGKAARIAHTQPNPHHWQCSCRCAVLCKCAREQARCGHGRGC
jgi:hypothetical protein